MTTDTQAFGIISFNGSNLINIRTLENVRRSMKTKKNVESERWLDSWFIVNLFLNFHELPQITFWLCGARTHRIKSPTFWVLEIHFFTIIKMGRWKWLIWFWRLLKCNYLWEWWTLIGLLIFEIIEGFYESYKSEIDWIYFWSDRGVKKIQIQIEGISKKKIEFDM